MNLFICFRDEAMEKVSSELKKKRGSESLLEKHEKERKKKAKKDKKDPQVRKKIIVKSIKTIADNYDLK